MKRFLVGFMVVVAVVGISGAPAYADVLFTNGVPGQPYAVGSNSGSTQGQVNRSVTGTTAKFTNDGWRFGM